jgi:hypothetical protein
MNNRYFRAFVIDDDRPCQVVEGITGAHVAFAFPPHTKTTKPFPLDLISTLLIRTRRISCLACTLSFWTLHAINDALSSPQDTPAMSCSMLTCPCTFSICLRCHTHRPDDKQAHTLCGQHRPRSHRPPNNTLSRTRLPACRSNAASPLGAPQHDSIQASFSPTLHFRGITHRNLCLRFRGIEIRFIWPPVLSISTSSISTATSHKSQDICHVHDGLDWLR